MGEKDIMKEESLITAEKMSSGGSIKAGVEKGREEEDEARIEATGRSSKEMRERRESRRIRIVGDGI